VIGDFADLVDEGPEGLDPGAEVLFDCRFHGGIYLHLRGSFDQPLNVLLLERGADCLLSLCCGSGLSGSSDLGNLTACGFLGGLVVCYGN